jgi:hypothetical protein
VSGRDADGFPNSFFGGSVTQDDELILVAELADLELARRFAAGLGGDLSAADTDHGDSQFVG